MMLRDFMVVCVHILRMHLAKPIALMWVCVPPGAGREGTLTTLYGKFQLCVINGVLAQMCVWPIDFAISYMKVDQHLLITVSEGEHPTAYLGLTFQALPPLFLKAMHLSGSAFCICAIQAGTACVGTPLDSPTY